ncbi:MAG TPA: M20/M25/M40 family metallo-hydrolase [Propionibacteriaceae bacterium]
MAVTTPPSAGSALKEQAQAAIDKDAESLIGLAHDIHAHPQLAFAEEYAAARISEHLERHGFNVQRGVHGMPTAFVASRGKGPLHLVFCAEYDALPPAALSDRVPKEFAGLLPVEHKRPDSDVHACGHNIIAGAAVAAATGLCDLLDDVGLRVSVFGTPAEELIGLPDPPAGRDAPGKTVLVEAGAFNDVHAALMVHPFPTPYGAFIPTHVYGRQLAEFSRSEGAERPPLATAQLRALEAALSNTISDLGQTPQWSVTRPEDAQGGAQADIFWLASSLAEVDIAREAIQRCLEATASANGQTVSLTQIRSSAEMLNDPRLSAAYQRNAVALGRVRELDPQVQQEVRFLRKLSLRGALRHPAGLPGLLKAALHPPVGLFYKTYPAEVLFGTDMADVSQIVPAIHPFIGIGGIAAPHSIGFTTQADSALAYHAMLDAGVALAWTALDAATEPELRIYLLPKEGTARTGVTASESPTVAVKYQVHAAINQQRATFIELAHDIHQHPELAFAEAYAAERITQVLTQDGFTVRTGVGDLPTAFTATTGNGPLHVGFCAEYDALDEGIGHGCGHNLIAGAAVAAAVGLKPVAAELGLTVSVIGTPGEELLGLKDPPAGHLVSGKIVLLEAGVFDGLHAVLMLHPGPSPYSEFIPSQAGIRIHAQFSKVAGVRGIDATIALELERGLRRALVPLRRAPYFCRVAPEGQHVGARVDMFIAGTSVKDVDEAREPVRRCLQQAASAARVSVEITEYTPNAELHNDELLAAAFRANAEELGRRRENDPRIQAELKYLRAEFLRRTLRDPRQLVSMIRMARHPAVGLFLDQPPVKVPYGTDLGQLSHALPAIHPMIGIGGTAPNNTAAFTPLADTDEAYRAMLDGAVALAETAVDAATDPDLNAYLMERAAAR